MNHRRVPKGSIKKDSHAHQFFIYAFLFIMFAGTGTLGAIAYHSSTVELRLVGKKKYEFSDLEIREYEEPGYYARHCVFSRCHDLTGDVAVTIPELEKLKNHIVGEYKINYTLDYLGETYTDIRTIIITDSAPPELTLNGPAVIGLYVGEPYTEPGWSAIDDHDGDLTSAVSVEGGVDTNNFGVYNLKYTISDSAGNTSEASRRVFVYNYSALSSEPIANFDELRDYIVRNGWNISFGFKNFEKNVEYAYRPDDLYYGASLVKTIDAMYVYENLPITAELQSLVRSSITYSNNSAHTSLASRLGLENLRSYAARIGMTHHLQGSVYYGDVTYFCDTTVADQMAEWTHLWELINHLPNGEELKWYFINNYWDNLSFAGSPIHMYKNGLYGNNYHESGIMFADSPFFMTFLSTEGWRWNATYIMADLAERTYLINQTL
ncbi:DUF5011 domain-containing protein [Candidatus Saccharibacteria bacterium]|nr:DUF5011 domain-containing protein [Candidatus Saccharibacteria bacterium]